VWRFFRQQLVRAVRRGAKIQEKIVASDLTDSEAYQIEGQMIGKFHKQHSGQLWNTIDAGSNVGNLIFINLFFGTNSEANLFRHSLVERHSRFTMLIRLPRKDTTRRAR
jgi:hypothetical protein